MVVRNNPAPDCGDIILVSFDPTSGSEQRGKRLALVLSPRDYNRLTGLCVAVPITSHGKGYPFEVALVDRVQGSTHGFALADQVRCLSWQARQAKVIDCANPDVLEEVRGRLAALLQLAS